LGKVWIIISNHVFPEFLELKVVFAKERGFRLSKGDQGLLKNEQQFILWLDINL